MPFSQVDGIALITCAGSGIGEETGYAFAGAGALGVVFADINYHAALWKATNSKFYATNPNYRSVAIKVDTSEPSSVQEMVDSALKEFGRIDYCINSAGIMSSSLVPATDIDIENFDKVLKINTRGVMLCVRAVSKVMMQQEPRMFKGRHGQERSLGRGCIINLGSLSSITASKGMMAYVASKHALLGIPKVAASYLKQHGIRVNAVCPAPVATPMMDLTMKKLPRSESVVKKKTRMPRVAWPGEVANVAVFLCSPSSTYISGTEVVIDAGISASITARI
ncbi:hypothetical protein HYALB_00012354 [Hymenoscyphus albidus]|uniref:NAD(P)-binding protein n=1 Tax=Hymenoscyphus albidus TaxID=595503 RepID=A0A9N9PWJ9_9HELO|nr:hypothetical protein HYALB_00012354 [Hymenoscyphus albidus]